MTFRQKYFDWTTKKFQVKGYEREYMKNVFNRVSPIVWVILKFIAYVWLMNRIYDRIGIERTVVFLMVVLIMNIRFF